MCCSSASYGSNRRRSCVVGARFGGNQETCNWSSVWILLWRDVRSYREAGSEGSIELHACRSNSIWNLRHSIHLDFKKVRRGLGPLSFGRGSSGERSCSPLFGKGKPVEVALNGRLTGAVICPTKLCPIQILAHFRPK